METVELGFQELVGFTAVVERLQRGIRADRVAHAQIFLGPKGSGKRSLAKVYARALFCIGKGGKPCDFCGPCRRMLHGNHPDYIEIFPTDGSVKVADIKALQAEIAVRPYEGGRKVLVVHDAHTMKPEAQNKLLKVLEEPPAYAVLLLLSETSAPLLSTVQSRCQTVRMPRVNRADVAGLLRRRFALDADRAEALAALSDGRVGRAMELARTDGALEERDEALRLLGTALRRESAIEALEELERHHGDVQGVLRVWQNALRDAMVLQCPGARLIFADRRMQIARMTENYTRDDLLYRLDAVLAAERRLRENGAFPSVCHRLLLKMGGHTLV